MGQIENLRAFVAIVQNESIGKAAALSGIAKSAMSRRLRLLEDQLQSELIVRTTRQWEITEAGRQYYGRAVDIIAALDDAEAALRDEKRTLAGDVQISVPMFFGKSVLIPHLLKFYEQNRDVHLFVDFSDRMVDLIGERYDLAIRIGRLSDSSMIAKKLCETQHIFCASPEYLRTHSAIERPEDLKSHQILQIGHARRFSWQFSATGTKLSAVKLKSVLNSDNGDFLVAAAERGRGIARIPDFLTKPAMDSGRLVEILTRFRPEPLGVYILYPASHHLPTRVRALIDHLADQFSN